MIKEYFKRGQKMGYEGDALVYKVSEKSDTPVITNVEEAISSPILTDIVVSSQPELQLEIPIPTGDEDEYTQAGD